MFSGCKPLPFAVAMAVAGLAAGAANAAEPIDGMLDPSFADDGSKTIAFDVAGAVVPGDAAFDTVVDNFGRVYLVGTVATANGSRIGIVRLRKEGSVEENYGPADNGLVVAPAEAGFALTGVSAAFDADGNLLVGGTVTTNGNDDFAVCRFSTAGVLTAFPNGSSCVKVAFDLGGTNRDTLNDIAVQPNGKIVMVGSAANGASTTAGAVARLDTDGNLDDDPDSGFAGTGKRAFLPGGMKSINLNAVALMRNGAIVAVGDGTLSNSSSNDFLVARIRSNGVMDGNFDGDGVRTYTPFGASRNQVFNGVAVVPTSTPLLDQSIVVAGALETGTDSGVYKGLIARFAPNGDPAESFNGGYVTDEPGHDLGFNDIELEADGKIVVAGTFKQSESENSRFYVTRFKPDGTRDVETFNPPSGWSSFGLVQSSTDICTSIALQNNRIIVAGASLTAVGPPPNLDFSVIGLVRDRIFKDGVD